MRSSWNTHSHILLESFAKQNRPNCIHVQCHILTEAIENIKAFSGPMAITCILSKKKKKWRNINFLHHREEIKTWVRFFNLKCLLVWVKCENLPCLSPEKGITSLLLSCPSPSTKHLKVITRLSGYSIMEAGAQHEPCLLGQGVSCKTRGTWPEGPQALTQPPRGREVKLQALKTSEWPFFSR